MSELFVELFSEEIPARLQINARNELKKNIKNFFIDNQIKFNLDTMIVQHSSRINNLDNSHDTHKSQKLEGSC